MVEINFLSFDDVKILDKAYEGWGGLLGYLEYELTTALEDFIRREIAKDIAINETLKAEIAAKIEKK